MKYIKQLIIILAISLLGELFNHLLPLPIPASIYGMVLLFFCLLTGWIKLSQVKETGKFLIEIMPIMFIPAGVGLLSAWEVLLPILIPVSIITVITLILVMGATGRISQFIIHQEQKKGGLDK